MQYIFFDTEDDWLIQSVKASKGANGWSHAGTLAWGDYIPYGTNTGVASISAII